MSTFNLSLQLLKENHAVMVYFTDYFFYYSILLTHLEYLNANLKIYTLLKVSPKRKCGPNVKQLKFKFKQNPFPGEPNPNVLCIGGCDLNVLDTLNINSSSVKQRNANIINTEIGQNTVSQNNLRHPGSTSLNNSQMNEASRINSTLNSRSHINRSNSANNESRNQNRNNTRVPGSFLNNSSMNNTSLNLMPGSSRTNTNNGIVDPAIQEDEIVCSCNNKALLLTVRKDGPNKGRQFYKCASDTCKFFLWAIDDGAGSSVSHQDQQANALVCNCHQPAVLRTVAKAGPNTGRQFYSCPKPFGESCKFFKWADEANEDARRDGDDDWGGGGGGGGVRRGNWHGNNSNWKGKTSKGRGKSTVSKATPYSGQTRAKRKCGICGQEGHTRNKCPNN